MKVCPSPFISNSILISLPQTSQVVEIKMFPPRSYRLSYPTSDARETPMLRSVRVRFLVTFIPTCAIAVSGLWLAITRSGFWYGVGWVTLVAFGIAALLQTIALIDVLAQLNRVHHDVEQN